MFWTALWRKPIRVELPRASARNPKLVWIGAGLLLTIDHGADRIEIGTGLEDSDLEWLHGVLCDWVQERRSLREAALP